MFQQTQRRHVLGRIGSHGVEVERSGVQAWDKTGNYFGPLPEYDNEGVGLNVIVKIRKWSKYGTFRCITRWYTGPTLVDTKIETVKEDVFMMLLDASLATEFDLSFATHLFLHEPIDDAALLEQVTSRVHRLGCTGPLVETVNV